MTHARSSAVFVFGTSGFYIFLILFCLLLDSLSDWNKSLKTTTQTRQKKKTEITRLLFSPSIFGSLHTPVLEGASPFFFSSSHQICRPLSLSLCSLCSLLFQRGNQIDFEKCFFFSSLKKRFQTFQTCYSWKNNVTIDAGLITKNETGEERSALKWHLMMESRWQLFFILFWFFYLILATIGFSAQLTFSATSTV